MPLLPYAAAMRTLAGPYLAAVILLVVVAGGSKLRDPLPLVRALRSARLPGTAPLVRVLATAEIVVGTAAVVTGSRLSALLVCLSYAAFIGYQLGLGIVTIVTSAATFAVLALALLTQSPLAGALLGTVFGAARALPALLLRRVDTWEQVRQLAARLDGRSRSAARATAGGLAAGGTVLLVGGVL